MEKFATAKAPSRSSGSLTISFGLVSIPVGVYASTEDSGIRRSRFTADGHSVGMKNYDKETGEDVSSFSLKYQKEDESFVELTDEEIEAFLSGAAGTATVVGVMKNEFLSAYVSEGFKQVRTKTGKSADAAVDKSFVLLLAALEAEDSFALLKYVSRGKSKIAALTSEGYLHSLAFADEVREARPMPSATISDAEIDMARQLINAMRSEAVELIDEDSAKIKEYAESKEEGTVFVAETQTSAPVEDLTALLAASIAAVEAAA